MSKELDSFKIIQKFAIIQNIIAKKIQTYSTHPVYILEGTSITLHIFCALYMNGVDIMEISDSCLSANQLFLNCMYILDNIQTKDISSYVDIIKQLLYSKTIGDIQVCSLKNNNTFFKILQSITVLIIYNNLANLPNKDLNPFIFIIYYLYMIGESQFCNEIISQLTSSVGYFSEHFNEYCISSSVSIQLLQSLYSDEIINMEKHFINK